jgi:hypothetical protein
MSPPRNPRSAPRRKQLKSGIIAFHERHSTLPCLMREISDTGARLEVDQSHVPDTFTLIIDLDGLEAACAEMWRRGSRLGVRFTAPPRIRPPGRVQIVRPTLAPEKASLRRKPTA